MGLGAIASFYNVAHFLIFVVAAFCSGAHSLIFKKLPGFEPRAGPASSLVGPPPQLPTLPAVFLVAHPAPYLVPHPSSLLDHQCSYLPTQLLLGHPSSYLTIQLPNWTPISTSPLCFLHAIKHPTWPPTWGHQYPSWGHPLTLLGHTSPYFATRLPTWPCIALNND